MPATTKKLAYYYKNGQYYEVTAAPTASLYEHSFAFNEQTIVFISNSSTSWGSKTATQLADIFHRYTGSPWYICAYVNAATSNDFDPLLEIAVMDRAEDSCQTVIVNYGMAGEISLYTDYLGGEGAIPDVVTAM